MAEVFQCAEIRMNAFVSAFGTTDSPWTSRLVRLSCRRIVFPLAMGLTNRMNRGEIDHVETHFCDLRQNSLAVFESAVRSRKHLVPGAEARANRVYRQPEFFVVTTVGSVG